MTAYFGRFPVTRARVHITASQSDRVSNGVSFGDGGPRCRISVGRHSTLAALYNDWVLTHEMIHFSFPSVEDRHRWIEEGIATYVEPIARASVGILTAERVWADMLQNMSQGLPRAGDRGLDQTHTWARTYWGGALFCLVADVEIRKRTGNSKGLRDALCAINRAGGTIDVDWSLERAFAIGDKATDGGTLMELYGRMAPGPVTVDLPQMWTQLRVVSTGQRVVLDDHAPWAAIRSAFVRSQGDRITFMKKKMKIQLRQVSTSTTEATLRVHKVLIDRPVETGGADRGPTGGELFLAAVGGCFMSTLLAAIRAGEAEVSDVHTEVIGTLAESPARFSAIQLHVTIDSLDRELIEQVVEIAEQPAS